MKIPYMVAEKDGNKTVTAFVNGQQRIASKNGNSNFDKILEKLFEEDDNGLDELFDVQIAIEQRFKKISERVSVSRGRVYFDNDPIENVLSDHLLRLIHDGNTEDDVKYLVNFWEKVSSNPSEHSREHLMRWLNTHDFSITVDGDILAYKGLTREGKSIHSGPGIVNGVAMNGKLPNDVGNIMEISRESVVANSAIGCAFGLHVGTYEYADGFSRNGMLVEVSVNPRDVVSVPTDCADAKVRVCRYKVERIVDRKSGEAKRSEAVVNYNSSRADVDNDFEVTVNTDWNSL